MKFPWDKYEELELSKRNTLQIFITNRCNLKCDGCFARNVIAENDKDMSMEEYEKAVTNAGLKGAKQINILGGEPLLHSKLSTMCLYNMQHGFKTTIYTNGTLLHKFKPKDFHGAKIRVSLDSLVRSKKACENLIQSGFDIRNIDANYMITTKTSLKELVHAANIMEDYGCKVFFIFSMIEMANNTDFFYEHPATYPPTKSIFRGGSAIKYTPHLALPVMEYKKLIHEFLEMYNGNMEIHISKRGVFESTKSLPHNKCKFANYFIGGKIIQCPYDIVILKYQDDYEYDTRFCQQNSTCLMSKIKLQRRKKRKYPCSKCNTGELFDNNAGGMFAAQIKCNNPNCNYENNDISGCVTA